jgi:hypothetical protein
LCPSPEKELHKYENRINLGFILIISQTSTPS